MIGRLRALERSIIFDIIKVIILVLFTIPVWAYSNSNNLLTKAQEYENYNYITFESLNSPNYTIKPMSDIEGLNTVETQDILVSNNSNTQDDYYLVLKTNEEISDNTRININNNVNNLNEYTKVILDGETFYILDHEMIVGTTNKYVISLWNNEAGIEENINYDILVKNNI